MNAKDTLAPHISKLSKKMLDFPWENQKAYSEWLAQTYYYATETTPLLMLAGSKVAPIDHDLHYRFVDHVSEEKGHPELLISDLKKMGHDIKDFIVAPGTAALFQSQFFWLGFRNPLAFFGYIILLEGMAAEVGAKICERVEKAHGKAASRFWRTHAHEDIEHVRQAFEQVGKFPAASLDDVHENFMQSYSFYSQMVDHCTTAKGSSEKMAS